MAGAGQHRHGDAVDLHRRAAHTARIAEGDEQRRRVAHQTRAGVLRLRGERCAVAPTRDETRLQDVAVDLEDAAVARLDRGVAVNVERRRGRDELEVAPLGHGLPVLALALRGLPGLAAIALEHRPDERLRRRQAGRDAALGLAQSSGALGDDAAHGFESQDEGDQHRGERERFADQGKASGGCHGCCLVRWFAPQAGRRRERSRRRAKKLRSLCDRRN